MSIGICVQSVISAAIKVENREKLCVCGHVKGAHQYGGQNDACWDCLNLNMKLKNHVHDFKLDNLKYLEQQYEKIQKPL